MGTCANNSQKARAMKMNIFLKSILNHNIISQFTAPIGSIKDELQLQAENFNQQIWNEFAALRQIRDDSNQFYNIVAFFTLKQIAEKNDQELFQKVIKVSQSIDWQLYLQGKQMLKNQIHLKNKFFTLIQKVIQNNLFELYYSDIQNNSNFYVLCIIFFRNWISEIVLQRKDKKINQNERQMILDWSIQFNLLDSNLLEDIVNNMNLKINIYEIQTQSFVHYGNAQNELFIIKGLNQLYFGLPKEYFNRNNPSQIIYKLYRETNQARNVGEELQKFVGEDLNQQELIYEYQMNNEMFQQIKLRGFKRVRGDGNCFYTAFIYQYLLIVITKLRDQNFQQFLELLQTIDFNLAHDTIQEFPIEIRQDLKKIFLSYIYTLIGSKDQKQDFENEFKNTKSIFYALSIIYAKNLIHHFVQKNSEYQILLGEEAEQQIQQWELETDNIQVLLSILANNLDLILSFYFIDTDNKKLHLHIYQNDQKKIEPSNQNIYLLFSPGHYCIGLPLEVTQ